MPIYLLDKEDLSFPNPELAEEDGLLGIGGDLSADRLEFAYSLGIFPWYSEGEPIMWWSPDPRTVLFPEKFKVSKSLKQSIRNRNYEFKFDENFEAVIANCARIPRTEDEGTWITHEMQEAYTTLHKQGIAHSAEVYHQNVLVGGLYGVSLGNAFFGESMFFKMRDASKVALYYLIQHLKTWGFDFIDAQMQTSHLISLGAETIPRKEFINLLAQSLKKPTKAGKWKTNQKTDYKSIL